MAEYGNKLALARDPSGVPVLAHVIRVALAVCDDVIVSYNDAALRTTIAPWLSKPVAWELDPVPWQGPLQALGAVLGTRADSLATFQLIAAICLGLRHTFWRRCANGYHVSMSTGWRRCAKGGCNLCVRCTGKTSRLRSLRRLDRGASTPVGAFRIVDCGTRVFSSTLGCASDSYAGRLQSLANGRGMHVKRREVPVEDAIGMQLAHDMTRIVPGEFKGRQFRRGHVIQAEDIPVLLDMGKRHIYVLELDEGELHEDDAAVRMAKAIADRCTPVRRRGGQGRTESGSRWDVVGRCQAGYGHEQH
ncbi:hypothetical protein GCM10025858_22100 [Alicyclobacillus sacchari]|nr:hypothetical protein GCM10025858_22100 [Alicyclobacillus sacchari]